MVPFAAPPLSLAIAGFHPGGGPTTDPAALFRAACAAAAQSGCSGVHLDGTLPGMRARELDRSARAEIAAALKRSGLACSGVDLWIPSEHFAQPSTVDRAVAASVQAITLAADVARASAGPRPVLSFALPDAPDPQAIAAIATAADRAGVAVADHAVRSDSAADFGPLIGRGIDPAAALAAGRNPAALASAAGAALTAARLSDLDAAGHRCTPGAGRLDTLAYAVALVTARFDRPVVLDVRAVTDPLRCVIDGARAWCSALPQ